MDAIIKPIEKMKPFFDKVARNKYLKAIKDGFISVLSQVSTSLSTNPGYTESKC